MRKGLAAVLVAVLLAGLVGCSNQGGQPGNGAAGESQQQPEPLTEAEIGQMYSDPDAFQGRAVE